MIFTNQLENKQEWGESKKEREQTDPQCINIIKYLLVFSTINTLSIVSPINNISMLNACP